MEKRYQSLAEFYPYYLSEHRNGTCRVLHVLGSLTVITLLTGALVSQQYLWLWLLGVAGYGPAWAGHFFFEKNRPATFQYPLYSFVSDWIMLKDILIGKVPLTGELRLEA